MLTTHRSDRATERDPREVPRARTPLVLLADDDAELRLLVAARLRAAGFMVKEAPSGFDALDRVADGLLDPEPRPVDVIVTDLRMPGCSGLLLLRAVHEFQHDLPVIVVSGFVDDEARRQALSAGALAVFDKPFDVDDLIVAVRFALEVHG